MVSSSFVFTLLDWEYTSRPFTRPVVLLGYDCNRLGIILYSWYSLHPWRLHQCISPSSRLSVASVQLCPPQTQSHLVPRRWRAARKRLVLPPIVGWKEISLCLYEYLSGPYPPPEMNLPRSCSICRYSSIDIVGSRWPGPNTWDWSRVLSEAPAGRIVNGRSGYERLGVQ